MRGYMGVGVDAVGKLEQLKLGHVNTPQLEIASGGRTILVGLVGG